VSAMPTRPSSTVIPKQKVIPSPQFSEGHRQQKLSHWRCNL
jgi:hypothetical protein